MLNIIRLSTASLCRMVREELFTKTFCSFCSVWLIDVVLYDVLVSDGGWGVGGLKPSPASVNPGTHYPCSRPVVENFTKFRKDSAFRCPNVSKLDTLSPQRPGIVKIHFRWNPTWRAYPLTDSVAESPAVDVETLSWLLCKQ